MGKMPKLPDWLRGLVEKLPEEYQLCVILAFAFIFLAVLCVWLTRYAARENRQYYANIAHRFLGMPPEVVIPLLCVWVIMIALTIACIRGVF